MSFNDFPSALQPTQTKLNELLQSDPELKALTTSTKTPPPTFGIKSSSTDATLLVTTSAGSIKTSTDNPTSATFTLSASPEQWEQFFQQTPKPPYQSYLAILNTQPGAEVLGDQSAFSHHASLWRRVLELAHEAYAGPTKAAVEQQETEADHLTGKYIHLTTPGWGKTKVLYEYSGEGNQHIVFLHGVGSDTREYHGVMNDARMRKRCTMYAFDLPGHGKSFPGGKQQQKITEESYIGVIAAFIKQLGLRRPILCGGQICLAVASRNREVGAGGIIPVSAAETTHPSTPSPSIPPPERISSLLPPTTPTPTKSLLRHLHSSSAAPTLSLETPNLTSIDANACPVYFLTGSYDWATPPSASQATAERIPGARFKELEGLGAFPATEDPRRFVGELLGAVEHVKAVRSEGLSSLRLGND